MVIKSVFDPGFKKYGQVMEGYDFSELFNALDKFSAPSEGIVYQPSIAELEGTKVFDEIKDRCFGGMPIQIGYCNGTNDTLNCLEYHKSSECNIAKDDIVLILGIQADISDGKYDTSKTEAFYVPGGVGVELYATTLHYAPCGYNPKDSYKVACVLPRGTNYDAPRIALSDNESKMMRGSNKWLLSHSESNEASEGAYIGLIGENLIYKGEN